MWPSYQPLLRADFRLFDEYEFKPAAATGGDPDRTAAPFQFPVVAFWGEEDRRISKAMVQVRVGSFPPRFLTGRQPSTQDEGT
jgi:surfactin synthase thioesterase subunit